MARWKWFMGRWWRTTAAAAPACGWRCASVYAASGTTSSLPPHCRTADEISSPASMQGREYSLSRYGESVRVHLGLGAARGPAAPRHEGSDHAGSSDLY